MIKKVAALMLVASVSSLAQESSRHNFNISLGVVNGKAGEYVYEPESGQKISYLDWDIKNIPVVIGEYNYTIDNFDFGVKLKKNINKKSSGSVKDYDWYSEANKELTPEVTPQDYGKLFAFSEGKNKLENLFSAEAFIRYWIQHNQNFKSGPILGIKYDYFKFSSLSSDTTIYELDGSTRVEKDSKFGKSLIYSQKYLSPYLGYGILFNYEKLTIKGDIRGSYFGRAKAHDRHLERGANESFEKYKDIKGLSSTFEVLYAISPNMELKGGYEFSKYFKNRKSSVKFIDDDGKKENVKNLGGLKNINHTIYLGINYKF